MHTPVGRLFSQPEGSEVPWEEARWSEVSLKQGQRPSMGNLLATDEKLFKEVPIQLFLRQAIIRER